MDYDYIYDYQIGSFIISVKVDREDQFQCPGFLHIIKCVFLGYEPQILLKNWMLPMLKNPTNLKSLTVNLVKGLVKQCSQVQIFLTFL